MFRFTKHVATLALLVTALSASAQDKFQGIGRPAKPAEIKAWDIDVRPDFKGLPPGSGSVKKGQEVWEAKCESCHGAFGESNEVFTPIVGNTTADDIKTGRVASLVKGAPQTTTLMKVATLSTLWDYINRAMPWNAPKTLKTDEVYAVTAYILSLGGIVPDDYVLTDKNVAQAQARMPNRNGMTEDHALWPGKGVPDVKNTVCMSSCVAEVVVRSQLPDYARNAHGNLLEQNRDIGSVRGTNTAKPASMQKVSIKTVSAAPPASAEATAVAAAPEPKDLAKKHACLACHGINAKVVGPGLTDIAKKYQGNSKAVETLTGRVKEGATGVWGSVPMPAQAHVPDAEITAMVQWILSGAK